MQNPKQAGVDYFNREHWLASIQSQISIGARRRMFNAWIKYAGPVSTLSILDLGATPDRELADSNCMIPWFQSTGAKVSMYSPENISVLSDVFPGVTVLPSRAFGEAVPAENKSYDWVTSSAVLEHTGNTEKQIAFIAESARLAKTGLFLTTPNRWHWLEFHTKLPLLHWLPRGTHRKVLRTLGQSLWAQESHLRLIGRGELMSIAAKALGPKWTFEVRAVWTLGMPSNLVLLAKPKN